jgi:hypothetical protein
MVGALEIMMMTMMKTNIFRTLILEKVGIPANFRPANFVISIVAKMPPRQLFGVVRAMMGLMILVTTSRMTTRTMQGVAIEGILVPAPESDISQLPQLLRKSSSRLIDKAGRERSKIESSLRRFRAMSPSARFG